MWEEMTSPDYFLSEVAKRNEKYYPTGYTGYEQYYTDMQGFWRELYDPDYMFSIIYDEGKYTVTPERNSLTGYYVKNIEWQDETESDCIVDYYVGAELNPNGFLALSSFLNQAQHNDLRKKYISYLISASESDMELVSRSGWNKMVFENPEQLNFWFDFLEEGEELS
jgi:hypothetical protein